MRDSSCGKCGRALEKGFIVDVKRNGAMQSHWSAGEPARGFFAEFKIKRGAGIPIITYRCTGCGHLDSYASDSAS